MTLKERFVAWRDARRFARRRRALTRALALVKPVDGMVASRAVYLQALEMLAVCTSHVERAGGITFGTRAALVSDLEVITRGLVEAMEIGDPALQLPEVKQRYVAARLRSESKKARARRHHLAALGQLEKKRPAPDGPDAKPHVRKRLAGTPKDAPAPLIAETT